MTKSAVFVNAGEAIIMYRTIDENSDSQKKGNVERKILHGPTQYIPHPKEWTHEFCWHGVDPLDKTRLIQGQNIFTHLRTIADQIYYNVSSSVLIKVRNFHYKLREFVALTAWM